jgi:hypothetical protein
MTESLGRFGKRFADEVVDAAFDLADAIHREAEPAAADSDPSPEVVRECLLFHTHVAGRFGFVRFGLAGRVLFVGALMEEVAEFGMATDFSPAMSEAQHTYEQYRELVAEPGQATSGTLCWEFATRLTLRFWPTKPELTSYAHVRTIESVAALLERFFAEAPAE